MGCNGLAFWISGLVAVLGAFESMWMGEGGGRMDQEYMEIEAAEEDGIINPLAVNAALLAAGGREDRCGKSSTQS